jgi:hypothetical protein
MTTSPAFKIELAAPKPRFFVEEGAWLNLTADVPLGIPFEPIELNRFQTRIYVENDQGFRQIFIGKQYFNLHHVNLMTGVGMPSRRRTSPLETTLDLMNFTRPLSPAHYQLVITYQPGKGDGELFKSNIVAFDIEPAPIFSQQYRWMAGKYRRNDLAALWTAGHPGQPVTWFFQMSNRRDPGIVFSAQDLKMPQTANTAAPVLAHITGPAVSRRHRTAVWQVATGCGWVRFDPDGRTGDPGSASHGLLRAIMVDPPLQRHDGGISAIFLGEDGEGRPTLSLFEVDAQDQPSFQLFPWTAEEPGNMPEEIVAVWSESENPLTACVYAIESQTRLVYQPLGGLRTVLHDGAGTLRFLRCDQQRGRGRVLAVYEDPSAEVRSILGWDIEHPDTPAVRLEERLLQPADRQVEVVGAAAHDEGAGMTLLFRTADGRFFASSHSAAIEPVITGALERTPELVITPRNGAYLVSFGPQGRSIVSATAAP